MRGQLTNQWRNIQSRLWFLPLILITLGIALAITMIEIDLMMQQRGIAVLPWVAAGTADGANILLSAIAGSLITVISIAFSITILAIQQAAVLFSPRVLRNFTRDRGNQLVLGTYIATFIYALLVLRSVRTPSESMGTGFVPGLAVTMALGLGLLCMGLLVYFIDHVAHSLQVSVVLDQIRRELVSEIEQYCADSYGRDTVDPPPAAVLVRDAPHGAHTCYVRAEQAGFVRNIDVAALLEGVPPTVTWLWARPAVGEFVNKGSILAEWSSNEPCSRAFVVAIQRAFVIDRIRTIDQDPLFGLRQLVDIGLKALSPAINDMTSAEYAIAHVGDALAQLGCRVLPSPVAGKAGQTPQVFLTHPSWADFVDLALQQIRRQAASDVHVTGTILHVLHKLAIQVPPGPRQAPLIKELDEIRAASARQSWSAVDHALIEAGISEVEQALRDQADRWELAPMV